MTQHRFLSIEEQGGIELFLNSTKELHNGLGYDDLLLRLKLHTPLTQIAKDFGVSFTNLKRTWLPRIKAARGKSTDT